jgi:hypothetical protein
MCIWRNLVLTTFLLDISLKTEVKRTRSMHVGDEKCIQNSIPVRKTRTKYFFGRSGVSREIILKLFLKDKFDRIGSSPDKIDFFN